MNTYRAHGKFLISAEYLVTLGAQALALPLTKMQQVMEVSVTDQKRILWQAQDERKETWIDLDLDLQFQSQKKLNPAEAKIQKILSYISNFKPDLFKTGLEISTRMNFSPSWGLGSSSTLMSLLAQWSGFDVWTLQQKFFGGSGYDIACATSPTPLLYQLSNGTPQISYVSWKPDFFQHLRFVYLGKKKSTQSALDQFRNRIPQELLEEIQIANLLTRDMLKATSLAEFQLLMLEHERLLSAVLESTPIQEQSFADFPGAIKSLGAWGGDFVLAASIEDMDEYFSTKGYGPIFKWSDLIEDL